MIFPAFSDESPLFFYSFLPVFRRLLSCERTLSAPMWKGAADHRCDVC